jgi:hypothetical protein
MDNLMYGIIAAVITIVIIGGCVGYYYMSVNPAIPTPTPSPSCSPSPTATPTPSPSPTATPTPTPTPEPSMQTQVRDDTMTYIEDNHPETAPYMQDLNWTGGRVETGLEGAENYVYTTLTGVPGSAGWTLAFSYPVVPNPVCTITVNYTQTGVQNPVYISWNGTWQDGVVTETGYYSNINPTSPPVQEQVRDDVMSYIQAVHVETEQFMQGLTWTGGKVDTGLVGSVQYVYTTVHGMMGGAWWTVEIKNPVVPNPIYIVNVNYTQTGVQTPYNVYWNGTWQDGVVTETGYNSNIPVSVEQIRDSIMNCIKISHNQTAPYMQDLNWTGGRVDQGMLVGSEKYNYTTLTSAPGAAGWTMTLQYPVVLNPIYTISANYTQTGVLSPHEIMWTGTWQKGIITENSYTFVSP